MEEVKISKIDVKNLKAVESFTAVFDGKSAHITGANGIGKSTIIRAFTDRLRGLKPSIIVKIGEKEGKTVMELTDGCRFEWSYNDQGRDELHYFTPNSAKPVRRDVFKHICGQYFPNQFDINRFLTTTEPARRLKMISELVNVDLTEIQIRYKNVFESRKEAKAKLRTLQEQIMPSPEMPINNDSSTEIEEKKVIEIESKLNDSKSKIEAERIRLNRQYLVNKKANDEAEFKHNQDYKISLEKWFEDEKIKENEIVDFNNAQENLEELISESKVILSGITSALIGTSFVGLFNFEAAKRIISDMPQPEPKKQYIAAPKPELSKLDLQDPMPSDYDLNLLKKEFESIEIELTDAKKVLEEKKAELSDLIAAKQVYLIQMVQFNQYQTEIVKQSDFVQTCESDVLKVLNEIKALIKSTKLPPEFEIDLTDKNDILFRPTPDSDYLPITNETLASSAIFIAAFKLQANYLENFRVAHFDVSYLDEDNRVLILREAIKMNIQLLTESPALSQDEKMLQYKITEI